MRLFGRRRAKVVIGENYARVVAPCEELKPLKPLAQRFEEGADECVAVFAGVELERLADALARLGEVGIEAARLEIPGKRGLLVCPVCLSPSLEVVGVVGLAPPLYVCRECGYRGSLVLDLEGPGDPRL